MHLNRFTSLKGDLRMLKNKKNVTKPLNLKKSLNYQKRNIAKRSYFAFLILRTMFHYYCLTRKYKLMNEFIIGNYLILPVLQAN